ncbi:MAG: phosphatase PAP2 family protein [Acidimicrobiia bacterium]
MWLDWHWAVGFAVVLGVAGLAARRSPQGWVRSAGAFARETALVLALYAVWNYAGRLSLVHVDEAFRNGRGVWDAERFLHLPSEVTLQHALLPSGSSFWGTAIIRSLNAYYAVAHVPALGICLVWLFVFYRPQYPGLRTTLAITTFACLLIQMVPFAPPRMYPRLGFIDAGAAYGPTVYGKVGTGISDQLSAMPSVHVAWAAFIALAVIVAGTSRWRYWILAHPVLTVLAVTATANHWWLDGGVAVAILFAAWGLDRAIRMALAGVRGRTTAPELAALEPATELASSGVPTRM